MGGGGGSGGAGAGAGAGGMGGIGGIGGVPIIPAMVTGTEPVDMAMDVASDTTVRATFNMALDPATVTVTSFVVRRPDGVPLAGSVAVDSTGVTAIFTPDGPLDLSSAYAVRLTTLIASASGGALGANFD